MKKLAIIIFTLLAFAAQARVIELAEMIHYPGFTRNPIQTNLTIFNNGDVYVTTHIYRENKTETILFKTLNDAELNVVKESVAQLTFEKLVDMNPEQPRCTDAPSAEWNAFNSKIGKMAIFREASCHEYFLQSWTNGPLADSIKTVLNKIFSEYLAAK